MEKAQANKPDEDQAAGVLEGAVGGTEGTLQDREVRVQSEEERTTPGDLPRRSTRSKTWEVKYGPYDDTGIQVKFPVEGKFPDIPEEETSDSSDQESPVQSNRPGQKETSNRYDELLKQSESRRLRREVERLRSTAGKSSGIGESQFLFTPIRDYHLATPTQKAPTTTEVPAYHSTPGGRGTTVAAEQTDRSVHPSQQEATDHPAGPSQPENTRQPTQRHRATRQEDTAGGSSANLNWEKSRSRDDDSYHLTPDAEMSSGTEPNSGNPRERKSYSTRTLPVRTIPVAEQYLIFRGDPHAEETHFVPGPSVDRWIESANNYFTSAEITDDVEKIRRLASFVDPLMGNARLIVKQKAENKLKKQESYRQFCDGIRAFYSTKVEKDYFLQVRRWFMPKPPMSGIGDLTNAISQAVEMSADMLNAYSSLGVTAKFQLWEELSNEVRKGIQEFILITTLTSLLPSRLCEEAIWKEDLDTDPDTLSENVILHARKTLKDHEVEARSRLMDIPQPAGYFIVPEQLSSKKRTQGRINQISNIPSNDDHYEERSVQGGERPYQRDEGYECKSDAGGINAYQQGQQPDRREAFQKTPYGRGRGRHDPTDRTPGRGKRQQGTNNYDKADVCFVCLRYGHRFTNCKKKPPAPRGFNPKNSDWCRACYGQGHRAYHHAHMLPDPGPLSPENECSLCQGRGHIRQHCPNLPHDRPEENGHKSQDFRQSKNSGRGR